MSKITIFKDIFETSDARHIHVSTALKRIEEGKSRAIVESIRNGNKDKKKNLPCVLFSGEFSERKDDAIFDHSGFIVLDFDDVDVPKTKGALAMDNFVYSCWVSPSGNGVKALVEITNPERHEDHFRSLVKYFDKQYGVQLDETGKNLSRACYESYDPDIIIKESWTKFGSFNSGKEETQVPVDQEVTTDYMKLNLAANMIRKASDGEKHSTLLKAAKLCGGYIAGGRMEQEEVVRVLMREISKKDIESEDHALSTIIEAIEIGKTMPLRELINDEKSISRDLLINDGDMSFISSDDDDFKWIDDFANGNIPKGLDTGDKYLDSYFKYKKEFLIINGHSNVGKTTTALYMIVNSAVRHKWKWIIYSSENKTASVKKMLMEFKCNKKVSDMNYNERKASFNWVKERFTVISNKELLSYSDLIIDIEKVLKQEKFDAVFIDPYNSLRIDLKSSGFGTHEYHYEAASEFLTMSKNNDIAVWVNMHAVTEAQRRKGADGLPIAPFAEDTEGGSKFVNRCDCFLTIHRKVQSDDPHTRGKTEIHVRKVRETETGGQPTSYDNPYLMSMDTSHTAFKGWLSQNTLFEASDTQEVKPLPFNVNFMSENSA